MNKIKFKIWEYWNLIEWMIICPIQSRFAKKDEWYCPVEPSTGFMVWKIIHDKI